MRLAYPGMGTTLLALLCITTPAASADELFPDENLRNVIKEILKQKQIDKPEIAEEDLKTIFFLKGVGRGIADLTGLEKCTNLVQVELAENTITSVQPLAGLGNLQFLDLAKNQISDVSPLAGLVKLQYVKLDHNVVAQVDGLEKLQNLRALYLSQNKLSSLAPLAGLAKLQSLYLDENQIVDLSPLSELKWLSTLALRNNQVANLQPLGSLTELRFTFLEGNPLTDLAPLVEMARKDAEGEQRFAPYWNLYLDVDALSDAAKQQVEELKTIGVRVNRRD